MSRLIELNALAAADNGVYSNPESAQRDFAYSDGSEAERYLYDVLNAAGDLSSTSEELQLAIRDWPSEYHLTPKRGNLFRGLPLAPGSRVLELGCGCGAVTRYLGEQGCAVDAVEGSAVRAALARMRCRDLDAVTVVQANFNRLELPAAEYDLVLLIGVAEYARMFSEHADSDRGAVLDLLSRARGALREGGRVVVAIENRTGMKYLHGAHEDHYSLRFVGIDGYRRSAGIRTYTRAEWRAIAADAGLPQVAFQYPFPDYKVPTVILGEEFAAESPWAWCQLEGIDSEDYTFLFDPMVPETLVWQGYNAAGVLPEMANSFLLVLSADDDPDDCRQFDFLHLPDYRRRREFCTVVAKRRGETRVTRTPLNGGDGGEEPFFEGPLLSSLWARAVTISGRAGDLHRLLRQYREFISGYRQQHSGLPLDLLPNNIVVDDDGGYRVFDQEWRDDVDVEYLMFRALLTFASLYRSALRQFARRHDIHDVRGFVRHALRASGHGDADLDRLAEREDAFQGRVLLQRGADTSAVLDTVLDDNPVAALVYPRLYWNENTEQRFDDARSIGAALRPTADAATLNFELPPDCHRIDGLRLDPCDANRPHDSGFLNVERVAVIGIDQSGSRHVLWSLDGEEIIVARSRLDQLTAIEVGAERTLAVTGDDPHLVMTPALAADPGQRLTVEVTLRFTASREYRLARQHYLAREAALGDRLRDLERRLAAAGKDRAELDAIRRSRSWRLLTAISRRLRRR